jgi:hypothetical protein
MAAIFQLPKTTAIDADGEVISGATLNFYDATTTTPQVVYSDSTLLTPISQPIAADSAGRFPKIYTATGSYKIVLKDSLGATIYTEDNLDSGIPAGSGALAVVNGGTGATTAAGARTSLAAASQTEVDALSSDVADVQAQITAVGGSLGDLAGRDDITRSQLATGFGVVTIQNVLVNATASVVTCSGTIPYDDSIPQNSEGTQVLTGSFTPVSASSVLEIEVYIQAAHSTTVNAAVALFKDTAADAIAAQWQLLQGNSMIFRLRHRMASPGTSAITFAVRAGGTSATLYVNGNASGTRLGGGITLASMLIKELLTV